MALNTPASHSLDPSKIDRSTLHMKALCGRAEVLHFLGRLKASMADYEHVAGLARDAGQKQFALAGLSVLYGELGDYDRELYCANRLISFARNRDLRSRGRALIRKAGALRDKGNLRSSLKSSERGVILLLGARKDQKLSPLERQAIQLDISNSYKTMGMVYNFMGKYDSSLDYFNKSLHIAKIIDDQAGIAHLLNNIGLIHWHKAALKLALDHFNQSLAVAMRIGYSNVVSTVLGNLGLIYNERTKYKIALGYFQKALKTSEEVGHKANMATNLHNIGLCYENIYDYKNAMKYYEQSLNIFRNIGNKFGTAFTLNNIGGICLERGELNKSLGCLNEAENFAVRADLREIIIRSRMMKARVWRAQRKYAKSSASLRKTIAFAKKNKMTGLMNDAIVQYVKTAGMENKRPQAQDLAGYIAFLEKAPKKTDMDYEKCFVLITLIKYYLVEMKFEAAEKKFVELSKLIKRANDKKIVIESLIIRACLNKAAGRKYTHLLKKARARAKEIELKLLLDEIEECR
jgi:tetratricopeptide (TPR) repeat protein